MKCDKLEWNWVYYPYLDSPNKQEESALKAGYVKVVYKDDVDAAIEELKTEHHRERHEYIEMVAHLRRENAELKQKLESVQASMYADVVDLGMENRRLKRALWLARAERAKEMCRRLLIQGFDPKWENVERKCRAKAEEYK